MSDEPRMIAQLTDVDLEGLLHRAIRNTLILGAIASLVLWKAAGWRNAAEMATGAAISAASIFEWRRLARFILARLDNQKPPRGSIFAAIFFVIRLIVFGGAIYGSLECFRGSAVALLCGLALALATLLWEALQLLKA